MINRRHFLLSATAIALVGCVTDETLPPPLPEVGFAHLPPVALNVSRLNIRSEYHAPLAPPNAEHRFPTPPERAMMDWARTRLNAAGSPPNMAVAEFVVDDASVIETRLDKTKGFKGLLKYEPSERYDATIGATLSVTGGGDGSAGRVRVTASHSVEVSENATLAERERQWFDMVEALMRNFNLQMEQQMALHLGPWLLR
ncbi:MAG: hypothetical protein HQL35_11890 [Alphaproteobacteria bacterium]|nr:hypothetical protein [Alphaproteobacteria bacterium]